MLSGNCGSTPASGEGRLGRRSRLLEAIPSGEVVKYFFPAELVFAKTSTLLPAGISTKNSYCLDSISDAAAATVRPHGTPSLVEPPTWVSTPALSRCTR